MQKVRCYEHTEIVCISKSDEFSGCASVDISEFMPEVKCLVVDDFNCSKDSCSFYVQR